MRTGDFKQNYGELVTLIDSPPVWLWSAVLVAALIVAVLLVLLIRSVSNIEASVNGLLEHATKVAGNTANIPQLQATLQQQRNALATLLGQPAGTIDALLAGERA